MYNRVGIMGRFAQDPVLKQMPSGAVMATFTLAVDRNYKDQSDQRGVDWIDCVAWRRTADFVSRYFSKGRLALVDGHLQVRSWVDDSGKKRRVMEVVVEDIHFADSPRERSSIGAAVPASEQRGYEPLPDDMGVPFY